MKYRIHGHRHADYLFLNLEEYKDLWLELKEALSSITDEMIIDEFENGARRAKSISEAVNHLIKKELTARGWAAESYIFADEEYAHRARGVWRLDFAKDNLSVEVAFNHRSDIAWNLIKPTLASELNHVQKAIQTSGGVVIAATQAMKRAGGFDNAVGTYEDYVQYLKPMSGILTAPLLIIGLEAPETFEISIAPNERGTNEGSVVRYAAGSLEDDFACPECGCLLPEEFDHCESCGCKTIIRSQDSSASNNL